MFEKVPVQEKSFKGFLKRVMLKLKGYPRFYYFIRLPLIIYRKYRSKIKFRFGIPTVRFKIKNKVRKVETATKFSKNVKFSIVVPLYNTPIKYLKEMIKSVQNQTYGNWQLCMADGSDDEHNYVGEYVKSLADDRIVYKKLAENKGIAENTNECIAMTDGDFIALFDHDDLLHPSALFEMAKKIEDGADFVYTDEVTFIGKPGNITVYNYKPDYSPDTLRSYNYICHFTAFSRELLQEVGAFNSEYDGSQDYDLFLRLTEKANKIDHVRKALYFWRSHKSSVASGIGAKPYVLDSAKRALSAHLERVGLVGTVENAIEPSTYKINYEIKGEPLISIVIPTKDHIDDLEKCLSSVYEKSTYKNFEVVVVENNSTEEATFEYYKLAESKYENLKVIYWEREFNYSAINNFAVKQTSGEYVILLNNDIEVITPDWMQEMLMFAQRKDVGAVGVKLYYDDDTIQHAGVIVGLGGVAGHSHKYYARDNSGYMARAVIAQNLSACTAACLMIRRDVYDQVGGLDEAYAVAFNDVDLCMKIRAEDYLIVFTPFAEFYHYESKSRGNDDTPEKSARFFSEVYRFQYRWAKELKAGDPYYNPNLSMDTEDFDVMVK